MKLKRLVNILRMNKQIIVPIHQNNNKSLSLLLFLCFTLGNQSFAQGPPCRNTTKFPAANIDAPSSTGQIEITEVQFAGEYAVIQGMLPMRTYVFTIDGGRYITLRSAVDSSIVLSHGVTPLSYNNFNQDSIQVHFNLNDNNCGTDQVSQSTFVDLLRAPRKDTVTDPADSGPNTLRQLVAESLPGDTICFAPDIDTVFLTSGQITIVNNLSIIGNGIENTFIDGSKDEGGISRLFGISSSVTLSYFQDLTFQNSGDTSSTGFWGGALNSNGYVIIEDCRFQNNEAYLGGAIRIQNGGLEVYNSVFNNNFSRRLGGAINTRSSSPEFHIIDNCLFYENKTLDEGGAINFESGVTTTVQSCTFSDNTADDRGGAIHRLGGSLSLFNNIIYNNTAPLGPDVFASTLSEYSHNLIGDFTSSSMMLDNENLSEDPLFMNALADDYRLQSSSPAKDEADNNKISRVLSEDLDGAPRIQELFVDMGAYEVPCTDTIRRIYVDRSTTANSEDMDGTSWARAFKSLDIAIDRANCATVYEIWIAEGTYVVDRDTSGNGSFFTEVSQEKTFFINNDVELYGGFNGTESFLNQRNPSTNPTILSGDIGILNDSTDNAFHVLFLKGLSEATIIDGFIIERGNAIGGGIDINGAGALLLANVAGSICNPIIRNCTFRNNSALSTGGAVANDPRSGGTTNPTIEKCEFYKNNAGNGGAIGNLGINDGKASPTIKWCTFYDNSVSGFGGAIYNLGFTEADPKIYGSLFYDNTAGLRGPAIWSRESAFDLINSIVYNSSTLPAIESDGNNLHTGHIDNSIIWGENASQEINSFQSADISIEYSIVKNLTAPNSGTSGVGNLDTDPLFTDVINNDFHLQSTSPAIDKGNSALIPSCLFSDLDEVNRIQRVVDMGVYEADCTADMVSASSDTIYVDSSRSNLITPDGLTWGTAYSDLQQALDRARCSQDVMEIWMADGTYYPSKRSSLNGRTLDPRLFQYNIGFDVSIYGGFDGTEVNRNERDSDSNETIISGDVGVQNVPTDNTISLFSLGNLSSASRIDGLIFQDAYNDLPSGPTAFENSVIVQGDPTISNSIFRNNFGNNFGALSIWDSNVTIDSCLFESNTTSDLGQGGAISIITFFGVGANPRISNTTFVNNSAGNGGAVLVHAQFGTCAPEFLNCIFEENSADSIGGAVYNYTLLAPGTTEPSGATLPKFAQCVFSKNVADFDGGGIYFTSENILADSISIYNSVFYRNRVCTDINVSCEGGGALLNLGGLNIGIYGNIFWENGVILADTVTFLDNVFDFAGFTIPKNSLNTFSTNSMPPVDPLFVDPENGNFRLRPYSPAINTGSNIISSIFGGITTDLDGASRIVDGTADMGPYENPDGDCPVSPILDATYSPLDGTYSASSQITIQGDVEIENTGDVMLFAPIIEMESSFQNQSMGQLEIRNTGCTTGSGTN